MTDHEIRSHLMKQFYERRREGTLGYNAKNLKLMHPIEGVDERTALQICDQLRDEGLIEWKSLGKKGQPFAGFGRISTYGINVMTGAEKLPQESRQSFITIIGSTGVQIAGDNSSQQQTVSQEIEKLIQAINGSQVSETEKEKAKSKLREFLESAGWLFGTAIEGLRKLLGS